MIYSRNFQRLCFYETHTVPVSTVADECAFNRIYRFAMGNCGLRDVSMKSRIPDTLILQSDVVFRRCLLPRHDQKYIQVPQ